MSKSGRTYLSADARSKKSTDEFRMDYADVKSVLTNHADDLKRLLTWTVNNDQIVFKARPEAFGIVRIADRVIEVTPKFLFSGERAPSSFVSDLFNVTGVPNSSFMSFAETEIGGEPSSAFDWYFFSLLTQIYDFLRKYDRVVMHSYDEEVTGVRGRLKIVESIRAGKGLRHKNICEIQSTRPRKEFLGIIKGFVHLLSAFSQNSAIENVALKCNLLLREVDGLPFDKTSIKVLKSQAKLLISEHRKSAAILSAVFEFSDFIQMGVGSISHHCFSFNMNAHFERLVCLLLEKCVVPDGGAIKSGNDLALKLLNNKCVGLQVGDEDGEFDAESITIKPDAYILNDEGTVLATLDAKYKMLTHNAAKNSFVGIQSKDIQQILAYWLHFRNAQADKLKIGIVYPSPGPNHSKQIFFRLGFVELESPLDVTSLKVEIFAIDVLRAIRSLANKEEIERGQFVDILAA